MAYEEMCIKNPSMYEGDPNIPNILKSYSDLLTGVTKDTDLQHVPSEYIDQMENPDYIIYLKAQYSLGVSGEGFVLRELNRLNALEESHSVLDSFKAIMLGKGLDRRFLDSAVTLERSGSFSEEEWDLLVESVNTFVEHGIEESHINLYLTCFPKPFEVQQLLTLSILLTMGCSLELATKSATLDIPTEVLHKVVEKKIRLSHDWDVAVDEGLSEYTTRCHNDKLRETYKKSLRNNKGIL
jgi:hypothetical protein